MALWVLKGEVAGGAERAWLRDSSITVGWGELPDLATCQDREALTAAYRRAYPSVRGARLVRDVSQLYAFAHAMRRGDLVALPLYLHLPVAVGEIAGDYECTNRDSDRPHTRAVRWLATDVPRGEWDPDLFLALDSPMTLHRVRRRGAEDKVRSLVRAAEEHTFSDRNFEDHARQAILDAIRRRFPGDRLTELVQAIFEVRGIVIADDAPSSRDTLLGVEPQVKSETPRLYVAVAAADETVDAEQIERFAHERLPHNADQGVLVALQGFTADARRAAFELPRVVLWDAADLIEATLSNYERLPDRFHAAIPLKRVWVIAPSES